MNTENAKELLSAQIRERNLNDFIAKLSQITDVYLVGGIVRAALMGNKARDIDLASPMHPDELQQKLQAHGYKTIPTGISHGTITVVVAKENVEITTFRKPGARESNEFSATIEEDLEGRDFTINAIAFSLNSKRFIDPFSGISDIDNKILRATVCADTRIIEDPLRILRAFRFGPGIDFTIEESLHSAIESHKDLLQKVSIERIQNELSSILLTAHVRAALQYATDTNILQLILPEIEKSIGCEQNEFHTEDVFEHTLTVIERTPPDLLLRLTALFHDLGKPITKTTGADGRIHFYKHEDIGADMANSALKRLRYSNEIRQDVSKIVRFHMRPLDCGPAAVRRLFRDLGELFKPWLVFKQADKPPVMSDEEFSPLYQSFIDLVNAEREKAKGKPYGKLAVNGNDLIKLGVEAGPKLGSILSCLEEAVLENPDVNTYDTLITLAKDML